MLKVPVRKVNTNNAAGLAKANSLNVGLVNVHWDVHFRDPDFHIC